MKIIKYELKKIFNNRLCSVILFVAFLISFGVSIYNTVNYKSGNLGYYNINDMNGNTIPYCTVSSNNIDEYREKLYIFQQRKEIYDEKNPTDTTYAGIKLKGKNDVDLNTLYYKTLIGEITEEENEQLHKMYLSAPCIKEEFMADYFNAYFPVYEYEQREIYLKKLNWDLQNGDLSELKRATIENKAYKLQKRLDKGIDFGYDYGWCSAEATETISIILIIVMIFGNSTIFSDEYNIGIDNLLRSVKNGKKRLVMLKIISALIFCLICSVAFILICYLPSLIILGFDGALVGFETTHIEYMLLKFLSTLLGSAMITMIVLIFSVSFKKVTTIIFGSVITNVLPLMLLGLNVNSEEIYNFLTGIIPVSLVWLSANSFNSYYNLFGFTCSTIIYSVLLTTLVIAASIPIINIIYKKRNLEN